MPLCLFALNVSRDVQTIVFCPTKCSVEINYVLIELSLIVRHELFTIFFLYNVKLQY